MFTQIQDGKYFSISSSTPRSHQPSSASLCFNKIGEQVHEYSSWSHTFKDALKKTLSHRCCQPHVCNYTSTNRQTHSNTHTHKQRGREVSLVTRGKEATCIERLYFSAYDHLTRYWKILIPSIFNHRHKANIINICERTERRQFCVYLLKHWAESEQLGLFLLWITESMIRALPQMLSSSCTAMQMILTACAEFPGIHFHKDTLWQSDEQSFAPKSTGVLNGGAVVILQPWLPQNEKKNVSTQISFIKCAWSWDKLLAMRQSVCQSEWVCHFECKCGYGEWKKKKKHGLNLAQVNLRLSGLLIGFKWSPLSYACYPISGTLTSG